MSRPFRSRSYIFLLVVLFSAMPLLQSQKDQDSIPRNELKINLLYTLLEVPDVSYERLLSPDGGLGVTLSIGIEEDIGYKLAVFPYYRFYFGKGYANGFFLELNGVLANAQTDEYNEQTFIYEEDYIFAAGLGVGVGAKFLTRGNWIGEVFIGYGRYLSADSALPAGYPRGGITLGHRF